MSAASPLLFALNVTLMLFLCFQAARWVYAGQIVQHRTIFSRQEQPVEFWAQVAGVVLLAGALLFLAADGLRPTRAVNPLAILALVAAGLPAGFWLLRGLRTGIARLGRMAFDRRTVPQRYWATTVLNAAIVTWSGWYAFGEWREPWPRATPTIEPVVRAVRTQLRDRSSVHLANVRIDARSGRVCGNVEIDRAPHRFFGLVEDGEGRARIDDGGPRFELAFAQACSGGFVVPQPGG